MKKQTSPSCPKQMIFAAVVTIVFVFVSPVAVAQGKYKISDRVECDATQMGTFMLSGSNEE